MVKVEQENDDGSTEEPQGYVYHDREGRDDLGDTPFLESHVAEVADAGTVARIAGGYGDVLADPLLGEHRDDSGEETDADRGEKETIDPQINILGREGDNSAGNVIGGDSFGNGTFDFDELGEKGRGCGVVVGSEALEGLRGKDGDDDSKESSLGRWR